MEASHFDERSFFSAVHASGVRALLIGRRALVLLGLPLLTADYDYWIAIDDIERFNALAAAFQLHPTEPQPTHDVTVATFSRTSMSTCWWRDPWRRCTGCPLISRGCGLAVKPSTSGRSRCTSHRSMT